MTWIEACHDKSLRNLPYKVELNQAGKLVLSSIRNVMAFIKVIAFSLKTYLPHGQIIMECAIDTPEGTYVADVT